MQTFYHVAGSHYTAGSDLLCWSALLEQGILSTADFQWAEDGHEAETYADADTISLFASETEAREWFAAPTGATILRVELDDDTTVTRDSEGNPAVFGAISAASITVI